MDKAHAWVGHVLTRCEICDVQSSPILIIHSPFSLRPCCCCCCCCCRHHNHYQYHWQ